jgi:hypothetical protein
MKTFKEYLAESKKTYNFKVKVAGELPENFQKNLKSHLGEYGVMTLEKLATTPIQATPLDFPTMTNCEVHVFEVVCEYPVTSPELVFDIKSMGLDESTFRVRGSGEPSEEEQALANEDPSGESMLDEQDLDKGSTKIKHKDYFGDDFNKGFLKDLSKTAKQRTKDGFAAEYKIPKQKTDKSGSMSPMSNAGNTDPRKGN